MTRDEAIHILRICQKHHLPKPQRTNTGDDYELRWTAQVFTARARDYDAALHLCRYMYYERKGRSLG